MPKFKDWTGEKVGDLTVIGLGEKYKNGKISWNCRCKCGRVVRRISFDLSRKRATRCIKCAKRGSQIVHGMSDTKIYQVWQGIKARCCNPNNKSYENYGGRGISLCDDWKRGFQSFYDWAIYNGYEEGLSIERLDVNGNYEPKNCVWIPVEQQARNTRKTVWLEFDGERKPLICWAEENGLSESTVFQRYRSLLSQGKPLDFSVLFFKGNRSLVQVEQYSTSGEFIRKWESLADAARFGYDRSGISMCLSGKRKSASGYIWKRAGD